MLQGIVLCGVCGRKMRVQYHQAHETRSPTYWCPGGYADGDPHLCQSVTARPVDAGVVAAFLEAVSPLGVEVALRVLERIEQDRAAQRRQGELQVEQARYEARLAQRRYEAIDPENRLVAAELERRWNEQLERVALLEHASAQLEQQAQWVITAEERASIEHLAQDLPALWHAETTTNHERKELQRLAIEAVQLDTVSQPGRVGIQIHWRIGTITTLSAKRPAVGDWSLKTPAEAVAIIQALAPTSTYAEIAERLKADGWRTAFGHAFTREHVGYLCRRHGWVRGKKHP